MPNFRATVLLDIPEKPESRKSGSRTNKNSVSGCWVIYFWLFWLKPVIDRREAFLLKPEIWKLLFTKNCLTLELQGTPQLKTDFWVHFLACKIFQKNLHALRSWQTVFNFTNKLAFQKNFSDRDSEIHKIIKSIRMSSCLQKLQNSISSTILSLSWLPLLGKLAKWIISRISRLFQKALPLFASFLVSKCIFSCPFSFLFFSLQKKSVAR